MNAPVRTIAVFAGLLLLQQPALLHADDAKPTSKTFTYKKVEKAELEIIVHYPVGWKESDKRPAIVFFFGGGWTNGSVKQFETQAEYLASRGMVAARADYRVKSRQMVAPDKCVEDAKSAVRWLRQNAGKHGIDPGKLVAAGGSAGGHIAACAAFTDGLEAKDEDAKVSSKPNALVLFNPVLSFEGVPNLMSRIGDNEELGKQISPTRHLTKNSPPTLLFYGTSDQLMQQGDAHMKKAKEVGSRCEMITAKGEGHGFFNRSPWKEWTMRGMDEFLTSLGYLKGEPTVKEP